MTTLDEAIERELNIAHKGSDCWKHCSNTKKHCKDCMDEHRQNAEWLEELKLLREEKSEFQIIARDNYEIAYNKAIDDFVESISLPLSDEDICRIAEQLKAGGENE